MGFVNPLGYFRYEDDKADAALLAIPKQSSKKLTTNGAAGGAAPHVYHGQPMLISPV